MNRTHPQLSRLLAMAWTGILLLSSNARAQAGTTGPPEPEVPSPETIVQRAYSSLRDALEQSGTDFHFELRNLRTIPSTDFGQYRLRDLLTVAPSKRLTILRSETFRPSGGTLAITFEARWADTATPRDPALESWNPTLEEALEQVLERGGYRSDEHFVAITAYDVTVECLGEIQRYSAYFLWLRLPSSDGGRFLANDHVVDRVGETLAETAPIRTREEIRQMLDREFERHEESPSDSGLPSDPQSCVVDNRTFIYPSANAVGEQRHISGNHRAFAAINYQCSCDQLCVSRNIPSWINRYCYDTGAVSGIVLIHETRESEAFHPGEKHNATGDIGALASANYGCFVQECASGGCGSSYTIDLAPLDIGFKYVFQGAGLIWDGQMAFTPECGPCVREQPYALRGRQEGRGPFHRNDDPNGGSSGWNGGGCYLAVFRCLPIQASPSTCGGHTPCFVEWCDSICIE